MKKLSNIFSVENKIVVLTGGSGLLGQVFAKALANMGAKVVVLDIIEKNIEHKNISFYKVDITKRVELESILEKIKQNIGIPNVLINCAAIDFPPNFDKNTEGLLETDEMEKIYDKVMEVNVKGLLLCSQVFGKEMAKNNGGSIINISSIYGMISPDQRIYPLKKGRKFIKPIAYSVSKSAIFNLTRYMATYWGEYNVRVNTITFGGVFNNQDPEFVKNYSNKVPLGRMANKEEYIGPIIFLASDASSYMTGANLIVDGGYTAW
ncbi:MAG: SDR family oxidoreductase [Candidatus Micrarchaeia archaeon]